ncbi:MAG TPA: amidohydrolase family protein [Opitutaceae bacterium]|nr:amidohydrolase family protein [Opitutaceae bacterium]
MNTTDLQAIDSHAHFGSYVHPDPLISAFSSGSAEEVVARAAACGIRWTIASPLAGLLPRGRTVDVSVANDEAFKHVPRVPGLLQYVIVNPLQPKTYAQARAMLKAPWCVGIKIHPEEHAYRIADHGEELFAFFEEVGAPVMTHSGCENSLPEDFVPFADRYPGVRVLLAHLGNGNGARGRVDLQVRAVLAAKHRNLWVDTSSARSILPGLIEWGVEELGAERLLFGSDSPLYSVAMQRTRIETAEIPAAAKQLILRDNAVTFFNLQTLPANGFSPSV